MKQNPISADDCISFVAIVEQQSISGAAYQLSIPKATLSRRLNQLEAQLGQRLLIRTTRKLTLTEFGMSFYDHSKRIALEYTLTQDFLGGQEDIPRGLLRISMPGDFARYFYSNAITTFSNQYPEVEIEIDMTPRRVDLIEEKFDLVIRVGQLDDDSTLVAKKLGEIEFGLYANPEYLKCHPEIVQPSDLLKHQAVLLMTSNGKPHNWRLNEQDSIWSGSPPSRIRVNSPEMIQQLLIAGAGIGALPHRYVLENEKEQRIIRVLPGWALPPEPVWALMQMRKYLPAKTRIFLDHISWSI